MKVWFFCFVLALGGCKSEPRCPQESGESKPVDQALVAYLSMASALHHEADIAESRNDSAAARAALARLLGATSPGRYAEVREVRADTSARMAESWLHAGNLEAAERSLRLGLEEVPEENYYRGRLFEVFGLLLEARSKEQEAAGDLASAERSKQEAIQKLETAVRIQQAVIERATSGAKEDVP